MSEFRIEVVKLGPVTPLPNSDKLEITNVHGGYPCIIQRGTFKEGDLAVYVPVDSLVPVVREEFSFLDKGRAMHRVKAIRLRGTFSMGILIKAPPEAKVGQDLQSYFGIEKYDPQPEPEVRKIAHSAYKRRSNRSYPLRTAASVVLGAWVGYLFGSWILAGLLGVLAVAVARHRSKPAYVPNIPVYDIEGHRKHANIFTQGEDVWVSEKIHGCNCRYVYTKGKLHVASRTMFRSNDQTDQWWKIAHQYDLEKKLKRRPDMVLFGEVYGHGVQDLHYGCAAGEVKFAAFDVMNLHTRQYLDVAEFHAFCQELDIPTVPTVYHGPYDPQIVEALAESDSMICPGQLAEGVVIKPLREARSRIGRKFLKLAGTRYLTRKE